MSNTFRRIECLMLLAVLGAVAGCNQAMPPQGEWISFTSDDGRVSAKFPKAPTKTTQTAPSAIGSLTITMNIVESRTYSFMVSHLTYPVDPSDYDATAGLEGAVEGAATNVGGKILTQTDIEQSGFAGKEVLIHGKDDIFAKVRMYIDPNGPTLFQGLAVGSKEMVNGPDATFFLESMTVK